MKLTIQYSNTAARFLHKTNTEQAQRIINKIEELARKPLIRGTKKIAGADSIFRVRVGDYRILYEVDFEAGAIDIVKIDRRDKVYRK